MNYRVPSATNAFGTPRGFIATGADGSQSISDNSGAVIGRITAPVNGRRTVTAGALQKEIGHIIDTDVRHIATNLFGTCLGYYQPSTDTTHNAFDKVLGKGNLLPFLFFSAL